MEEIINLKKVNVIKAFKCADPNGKQLLKDLVGEDILSEKVTERIKSYSDACDEVGATTLTIHDFGTLPEKDREATFAFHQLTIIARALNEGWEPNWNDHSEYKYYPYFYHEKGGSGFSCDGYAYGDGASAVGSRLYFKTRELAEYAGNQFISIYNQFLKI